MLDVQDITVAYSSNAEPTIEGFHLEMKPGEICSIVGKRKREDYGNPFYIRPFTQWGKSDKRRYSF